MHSAPRRSLRSSGSVQNRKFAGAKWKAFRCLALGGGARVGAKSKVCKFEMKSAPMRFSNAGRWREIDRLETPKENCVNASGPEQNGRKKTKVRNREMESAPMRFMRSRAGRWREIESLQTGNEKRSAVLLPEQGGGAEAKVWKREMKLGSMRFKRSRAVAQKRKFANAK